MNYRQIKGLEYECNCTNIEIEKWNVLMQGKKRADKRQVSRLVKKHLPELAEVLQLKFYNPYNYYRTKSHLVLIHSGIEYFLKVEK